jgi:hypothetical protein
VKTESVLSLDADRWVWFHDAHRCPPDALPTFIAGL